MGSRRTSFFFLMLAVVSCGGVSRSHARDVLQSEGGSVIRVYSEVELQRLFENGLKAGTTLRLEMEELQLTKPLAVDVPEIAILGAAENLTRIACPPSQRDSALLIKEGSTRIEFVLFDRCRGHSAVIVETAPRILGAALSVTFENVHFSKNGAFHKSVSGGAVHSTACKEEKCVKPLLLFKSCYFSKNHATYGGAIYAVNADLQIIDCLFSENEADISGGALYTHGSQNSTLLLERSLFEDGVAHGFPPSETKTPPFGNISTSLWPLTGTGGAIFALNPANTAIVHSTFRRNSGCRHGGALAILQVDYPSERDKGVSIAFSIRSSRFEKNLGYCGPQKEALLRYWRDVGHGGAVVYASSLDRAIDWSIKNTRFFGNQAIHGGALHVRSKLRFVKHNIEHCSFRKNAAVGAGGGMTVRGAAVLMKGTHITDCRAAYGGGISVYKAGALTTDYSAEDKAANNRIEGCMSFFGGGLYATSTGDMSLSALTLRNNVGFRFGGGAVMNRVQENVVMKGVTVEGNHATVGGGIGIFEARNMTITSDDFGRRTMFKNNIASVGGGFFFQPGTEPYFLLKIEHSDLLSNEALPEDDARMKDLAKRDVSFVPVPEAEADVPNERAELGHQTLLSFLTRVTEGRGGALCIAGESLRPYTIAEMVFQHLYISKNKARVGGGMSIELPHFTSNKNSRKTCFPAVSGLQSCRMLLLVHVTVTGNKADYAGGIFAASAERVMVSCNATDDQPMDSMDHLLRGNSLEEFCSSLRHNEVLDGADGIAADVGTKAESLFVEGGGNSLKAVASGEEIAMPCLEKQDASCSRDLRIAVKDAFNQTIVRGIADSNLTLVLMSAVISGALRYNAHNGVAVINATVARGINKTSSLRLASDANAKVHVALNLTTRACYPGESIQGDVCSRCPPDQYGINSTLDCRTCEEFAKCDGGSALVPVAGYWHSTPFSPVLRQCIHSNDCQYDGRERALTDFHENATNVQMYLDQLNEYREGKRTAVPDFPDYVQCATGHEGLLCGSCSPGYGRSLSNTCDKCPDGRFKSRFFTMLSIGWLFLLIGANCTVMLISMKTRVQLVMQEIRTQPLIRVAHSFQVNRTSFHRPSDSRLKIPAAQNLQAATHETNPYEPIPQEQLLARQLVAAVQLAETLKILMNYLQVTSTALQVNADWNVVLKGLLSAEAFMSGFLGEVLSIPYACNFSESRIPPPMAALWMRMATPWIVLSALQLVFLLIWFALKSRGNNQRKFDLTAGFSRQRLLSCLIIISLVTVYFSYIDLVREFLRAVNCISIESPEHVAGKDHPYVRYAGESGIQRIWAEDTDFTCFEGKHLFVGIVGILGLLLCFSFILAIIFLLPFNRKHLTDTEFVARYWFLYQAYRKEWHTVAWESTILARKSLLDAVVVFAVHTGPAFQASLCAGILLSCLAIHSLFAPFKIPPQSHTHVPEYSGGVFILLGMPKGAQKWKQFHNRIHLNHLESASLTASIAVFYTSVLSDPKNSSALGRGAMTALAFGFNFLFLVYMLYRLYAGSHVWLDLKIKNDSPTCTKTWAKSMRNLNLVVKLLACVQTRLGVQDQQSQQQPQPSHSNIMESFELSPCEHGSSAPISEASSRPPTRLQE